jgi:hypothetical protein
LDTLKSAVEEMKPVGYANLTHGFVKAFELLEKVRQHL